MDDERKEKKLTAEQVKGWRKDRQAELRLEMLYVQRRLGEELEREQDGARKASIRTLDELQKVHDVIRKASRVRTEDESGLKKIIRKIDSAPRSRSPQQETPRRDVDAFLRDELGVEFADVLPAKPAFAGAEALPERPRWCEGMILAGYVRTLDWRELSQRQYIAVWLRFGNRRWRSRLTA